MSEWVALLADKDICFGPVATVAEALDDPHVRHRGRERRVVVGVRCARGRIGSTAWRFGPGDLLFAGEGASQKVQGGDPYFRAYDKQTGAMLWERKLEAHVVGAPMTYRAGGRQFVVVPTGGFGEKHELVAFALPPRE